MKMAKQQVVEEIYQQKNKQIVVEEVVPAATWGVSQYDEVRRYFSSLASSVDFSAGPSTVTTESPPVAPTWELNSPATWDDDEFRLAPDSPFPGLFSSLWKSADYSANSSTGTTGPPPDPFEPPTRFRRRNPNLIGFYLDKIKLEVTTGPFDFSIFKEMEFSPCLIFEFDLAREEEDFLLNKLKDYLPKIKFSPDVDKGCEELEIVIKQMKHLNLEKTAGILDAIISFLQDTRRFVMGRIGKFGRRKIQFCNGRPEIAFGEGLQEEIFVDTIKSFPNNEPDLSHEFVQISQNTRSPQGPQAYPNGADMQIGSSEQQPTVDFDITCNGGNIVITDQSDIPVTGSEKNNIKMISPLLSPEILPQLYGMKQDEAAKFLGVSRSTLKRECRKQGIPEWPFRKGKKGSNYLPKLNSGNESVRGTEGALCQPSLIIGPINRAELRRSYLQPTESIPSAPYGVPNTPVSMQPRTSAGQMSALFVGYSEFLKSLHVSKKAKVVLESTETVPPCSELPPEHRVSSIVHTMPDVAAMQDMKIFNIKATYRIGIIQFPLSSSSRKAELEENISERLNLNLGNFRISYMDTEGDWILITCDKDLQYCMIVSERLGHNTIKMLVEDITTM